MNDYAQVYDDIDRDTEWSQPDPLPTGLPPVDPFDANLLPETLRPWIRDITERLQCPPDYPAIAAVVCLAAVVGRQIAIRPKKRDDWTVVPNLWGAVVGRPSTMKTPALAEIMRMIQRLEIEARQEYDEDRKQFDAAMMVADERQKAAKKAIRAAIKEGNDPGEIARASFEDTPEHPQRRRYISNDPTVEKLGELLATNPRGILVQRDELVGWLQSLDREGREGARAFFLEAWNGSGRFTFDRIGRGTVEIESACVSILGGIQPGPLSGYLAAAVKGGAGDDGLLQRFQLIAWPDSGGRWRNIDRWPDAAAKDDAWDVFRRLDCLDPTEIGAKQEGDETPFLRFADEAQRAFDEWRDRLENRLRAGDLAPAMESHLAKYRSLVPSLALIFHLADRESGGPVGYESLTRALCWAEYLESHACRLYANVLAADMAAAVELSRRLQDLGGQFTAREVYRKHWRLLDRKGTDEAIAILVDHGWLRAFKTDTNGRPSTIYEVNPAAKKS